MISKDTLEYAVANQKKKITMQDAGLSRFLLPSLPDAASHALIISGVRRCGKSTLLLQMLKKQKQKQFYLNLDDPLLFDFDISDFQVIDQIIKEKKAQFLFFDEPQIVKGWEIYIKQKLEEKYRVFVTGSNASLLSRELGTRLTGRHITKELFPFSYQEFVKFEKVKTGIESFQKYIDLGGFPEYLKNQNSDILSLLFDDILNRDIIIRYGVRDAHSLKKLALYL
ncbi:MAG: AAA family ATPase, partial [Endomicrobium sp.]|nr:AAA family ATPase [Endomicrobium sp.]